MKELDDEVMIAVTYSLKENSGYIEVFSKNEVWDARAESLCEAVVGCVLDNLDDEEVIELGTGGIDHPSDVNTPGLSLTSLSNVSVQDVDPAADSDIWNLHAVSRRLGTRDEIAQG